MEQLRFRSRRSTFGAISSPAATIVNRPEPTAFHHHRVDRRVVVVVTG
jgi:hypothetical protein